jgi:hypothetical protein
MDRRVQDPRPLARKQDLIVEELPGELLVYDTERDQAHCLNETAAFVWKRCDGSNTPRDIARLLGSNVNSTIDEKVVWVALDQLANRNLLERELVVPTSIAGLSRRQAVRAIGLGAIVAVPLITSIVAPTAVQAATCLPPGQPCGSSAQCCSGLCSGGTCA